MSSPDMKQPKENTSSVNTLEQNVTLTLSPEQYERLFFQPSVARGDLAPRFGNPTILGLLGFLIPFTSTIFSMLQFGNSSPTSLPALTGNFFFMGGLIMILAGIFEFILGNTFPMVVFLVYGSYWLNTGFTYAPSQGIISSFDTTRLGTVVPGSLSQDYNASQGNFNVVMVLVTCVFLCGSFRTNIPFVVLFLGLIFLFSFFAAADYQLGYNPTAEGVQHAYYYFKIGGGFGFVSLIMAWYLAFISICASTGVPCPLPIFDLSQKFSSGMKNSRKVPQAGETSNAVA